MNEAAFRILLALLDKGNTRGKACFVGAGDKDQVIHATLGADAQYLRERFDHAFPGLRRLPLSATYRHGAHLALSMGKFKNKPSQSGLPTVTDIPRLTYPAGDWTHDSRSATPACAQTCVPRPGDRHNLQIFSDPSRSQSPAGVASRSPRSRLDEEVSSRRWGS